MERMILSLRSIYMLLMNEDFPIYSESVIGRNERKGQTMLRFWQGQIAEEFRCLPNGRMIWRNDGKRNRYTSYLCNRSAEIKTYAEYAAEIASQISISALRNQLDRFSEFLSARNYRHDTLIRRVRELMRLTEAEDPRVSSAIARQICCAADWMPSDASGKLFQASYLLTLLTMYAAAGEAMDDPVMAVLQSEEYSLEALWNVSTQPPVDTAPVTFLTMHSGLLQDTPLPLYRFFGREKELFDLTEIAASGRKCLISGIGGIGKTELLRQLIRRCCEENVADKIAVVPYEGGIMESFARCFPDFQRQDPAGSFRSILYRLEKESRDSSVLLLIDNLTSGPEEDPNLEQLQALPFGVIITSRLGGLEGFETYSLPSPTAGTGELIFRDNYGQPLSRGDREVLAGLLADEALCHPLTLRLMARAARSNYWSVEELRAKLDRKNASLTWQEEGRTVRLSQMYRQLYSYLRIPEECHLTAELFTLLPRDSYSLKFLTQWFPDIVGNDAQGKLDALTEGGWLDRDDSGYSMHPLIAQCLRRRVITEERVGPMLGKIQEELLRGEYSDPNVPEYDTTYVLGSILLHVCRFLSGSISSRLVEAASVAMCMGKEHVQAKQELIRLLEQMEKRCSDKSDLTELMIVTALGYNGCEEAGRFEPIFRRQKEKLTVPIGRFLDFCIEAGNHLGDLGEFDTAKEMIQEIICREAAPYQKACAYYYMITLCNYSGDAEAALNWAEQGAEYLAGTSDCGRNVTFRLLAMLCQMFIKFGRKESAYGVLKQIEDQNLVKDTPMDKSQYGYVVGLYEMKYGDREKALAHTREAMRITEEYEGRSANYLLCQGQIAGILREMGRCEEAVEVYQELVKEAERMDNAMLLNLYSTNLSTVYLMLKRPEEALTYLETAMILAREQGGIALGVAQHNRAQAFQLLGDTGKEYACLKEACPLLEEAYGPEHSRSAAARKRLEELEGKRNTD